MTRREALAAATAVSECRTLVLRLNTWGRKDVIDRVNRELRKLERAYHRAALEKFERARARKSK